MGGPKRSEIQRLRRAIPFRPFVLTMLGGQRVRIEHPENIAFDPGTPAGAGGSDDFYVISGGLRMFSTFAAITSIAMLDQGQI